MARMLRFKDVEALRDALPAHLARQAPATPHPHVTDSGKRALYALGRLKPGKKNQTEQRFEDEVLLPAKQAGEILWYEFEAIKLRLADNTHLTIDYAVLPASGVLEMIDVKGGRRKVNAKGASYTRAHVEDDALVKLKWAASRYPFVFKTACPRAARDGGGWIVEEV